MRRVKVMIMSGIEDGSAFTLDGENGDGTLNNDQWTLSIGRKDSNDIVLRHDTFVSRLHARIHVQSDQCWLEDCKSTNGSFVENPADFFTDLQVTGKIKIDPGQIFRIGRTWLRIDKIV